MNRPLDASLHGHLIDALLDRTTLWCTGILVVALFVLGWALLFDRAGRHPARYDHGDRRRQLMISIGGALAIFVSVDVTLLARANAGLTGALWRWPQADEHPLRIEIVAQQWSWNVRYPGADGRFGTADDVVLLNELHVPVGVPVHVSLRAKDVVHSLYLPNFRIKQDAIPGATTQLWFQATQVGRFEIGCAQYCGAGHTLMRGLMTVETPEAHAAWQADAARAAARRYDAADLDAHWGWDFGG